MIHIAYTTPDNKPRMEYVNGQRKRQIGCAILSVEDHAAEIADTERSLASTRRNLQESNALLADASNLKITAIVEEGMKIMLCVNAATTGVVYWGSREAAEVVEAHAPNRIVHKYLWSDDRLRGATSEEILAEIQPGGELWRLVIKDLLYKIEQAEKFIPKLRDQIESRNRQISNGNATKYEVYAVAKDEAAARARLRKDGHSVDSGEFVIVPAQNALLPV